MATLDWPNDRAFAPVQPGGFSLTPRSPKSAWAGFYTGNRQVQGHAADRLLVNVVLPACGPEDAARREAFVGGLISTGDYVRLGHLLRPWPRGTLRGSPSVAASASAGARSLQVVGALAHPNLWNGGSFEIDSNSDGVADGWTLYTAGSVGAVSTGLNGTYVAHAGYSQAVAATALGSSSADRIGVKRSVSVAALAGAAATFSASMACTWSGAELTIWADWRNSVGALVSSSVQTSLQPSDPSLTLNRYALSATVPASAVTADVYFWAAARPGSGGLTVYIDAAQFAAGAGVSAWAGFPTALAGDVLGVGGDLLVVSYAGAALSDAGAGTVPLALPLKRSVAAGAAVTHAAPTGRFELQAEAITFEHGYGSWQSRLSLPFLEA